MNDYDSPAAVTAELARLFHRNGYVRPSAARRRAMKETGRFRRGFELRLTASSHTELVHIRRLLIAAGFVPGNPFEKANQLRQPVYGRADVERFLALVGEREPARRE